MKMCQKKEKDLLEHCLKVLMNNLDSYEIGELQILNNMITSHIYDASIRGLDLPSYTTDVDFEDMSWSLIPIMGKDDDKD